MSFSGIRLASRALLAHQRSLEITGQNIANVDTPGYSRQVAVLRSVPGLGGETLDRSGSPTATGGGVEVAEVRRTHAAWLDRTTAALRARLGGVSIDARVSGQVESLLNEPSDGGLHATLERFYNAFSALAHRPEDPAARTSARLAGEEVALRFRQLTDGIEALKATSVDQLADHVGSVNQLTEQVAALNRVIREAEASGASANELLDQRENLLAELSRLAGVTVEGEGSEIVVSISGRAVVQGDRAEPLSLATDGSLALLGPDGAPVAVPSGEMRALQEWVNVTLPEYGERVAALRDRLAVAVNGLHQSGQDADGAAGVAYFLSDPDGNLYVNPILQEPRRLVAGDGTPGDGRVALAIAALRAGPAAGMDAYPRLVSEIGKAASDSRRFLEQTDASLTQVELMQASESGVNLDEELAEMVATQHAYAASARLLAAYDEMLATLIER